MRVLKKNVLHISPFNIMNFLVLPLNCEENLRKDWYSVRPEQAQCFIVGFIGYTKMNRNHSSVLWTRDTAGGGGTIPDSRPRGACTTGSMSSASCFLMNSCGWRHTHPWKKWIVRDETCRNDRRCCATNLNDYVAVESKRKKKIIFYFHELCAMELIWWLTILCLEIDWLFRA